MSDDPPLQSHLRLSLRHVPRRDRAAVYREVFGRKVVGLDVTPVDGAPFMADLTLRSLPGLQIVSGWAGASINRRTSELMADGQDGFGLAIVTQGACRVSQRGRDVDQTGTQTCVISFAEESTAVTAEPCGILCLQIPRDALSERVRHVDDLTASPISAEDPALRLLQSYMSVIADPGAPMSEALGRNVVTHIHDLVAFAVGATREAREQGLSRGVAAARLHGIKREIGAQCARPDFALGEVARNWGITPRQVQRLFATEETTFSAFTQHMRLKNAHAVLRDPRSLGRKISTIALDCGFGDVSHFNKTFRGFYGLSPSEVRASARQS